MTFTYNIATVLDSCLELANTKYKNHRDYKKNIPIIIRHINSWISSIKQQENLGVEVTEIDKLLQIVIGNDIKTKNIIKNRLSLQKCYNNQITPIVDIVMLKKYIFGSYNGILECNSCGRILHRLSRDHIYPLHRGGIDHIGNIELICITCNGKKGSSVNDKPSVRVVGINGGISKKLQLHDKFNIPRGTNILKKLFICEDSNEIIKTCKGYIKLGKVYVDNPNIILLA
jgi:5-methylcytosine-specific restriction endonuclease McrA